MRRWKIIVCLTIGILYLLACGEKAQQPPIEIVDDSPVLGVWYLQSRGEGQPLPIDTTVRFEFRPHGTAIYQRTLNGNADTDQYALDYNLTGSIISIDCPSADPGDDVPRITGMIEFDDEGKTLRISTHTNASWLLTRDQRPGGDIEQARHSAHTPADNASPMQARVLELAHAVNDFTKATGEAPDDILDLIDAGVVSPESLTATGRASDLPARFDRMTVQQRRNWLAGNSVFEFFFDYAGTDQASSIVVTTLPTSGDSTVYIGMANCAVYEKTAMEVARLLQFQLGTLPERWPDSAWSREATAGLEPLSD